VSAAVVVVLLQSLITTPAWARLQKTLMFTHSSRTRAATGMVPLGKPLLPTEPSRAPMARTGSAQICLYDAAFAVARRHRGAVTLAAGVTCQVDAVAR
jgi:hypothetical protein